jgi:hypothetical protein
MMGTMDHPDTTHDTESIDHLEHELEIPCDTCRTWIEEKTKKWKEVLPARWIGRISEHADCAQSRAAVLVCDYHVRYKGYVCNQKCLAKVDVVDVQPL